MIRLLFNCLEHTYRLSEFISASTFAVKAIVASEAAAISMMRRAYNRDIQAEIRLVTFSNAVASRWQGRWSALGKTGRDGCGWRWRTRRDIAILDEVDVKVKEKTLAGTSLWRKYTIHARSPFWYIFLMKGNFCYVLINIPYHILCSKELFTYVRMWYVFRSFWWTYIGAYFTSVSLCRILPRQYSLVY